MAAMMERIIRQFLGTSFEAVADREEEEQLVDLLENHVEEEMAQAEREGQVQRAQAQDQVQMPKLIFSPYLDLIHFSDV